MAKALSLFYTSVGASEVSRIPVLGREGPDIEINELGLIVDVKSRLSVPKSATAPCGEVLQLGDAFLGVRLGEIPRIFEPPLYPILREETTVVWNWWLHMDQWRRENYLGGISALVLHRPGTRINNATLVIHFLDWRKFHDRYTTTQ